MENNEEKNNVTRCLHSPNMRKKSIYEVLSLFRDGENRYNIEPIFRQTIDYIYSGGKPEHIIENLIDIINNQLEEIEKLLLKK